MANTLIPEIEYPGAAVDIPVEPEVRDSVLQPRDMLELFAHPEPFWKRPLDIVGATTCILLLSPLLLLITALIKITSRGPVLFKQQRAGLCQAPFTIYKFRSMFVNAEEMKQDLMQFNERTGPAFKMTNDPRITPIGKILRKWSLDELPQFFNVLKGDMSMVGPRPLPVNESLACEPWQWQRLDVKPGITCIWQIKARHISSFIEWARLDIMYIRKLSFRTDMGILFSTIPAILNKKGAC